MCMFPKIPIQWIIFKGQCGNEQISSILLCYLLHDMKYAVISQSQENFLPLSFSLVYTRHLPNVSCSPDVILPGVLRCQGYKCPPEILPTYDSHSVQKKKKEERKKENRIIVGALNIWLKERFLSKVTYRYRPRDCHTEWSKSDRERQISYAITYMWNLKAGYKWTYLQNRNRVIECRKQAYGCCCFCSVFKLCITLCEPMDCSTPGFLVPHLLPESAQLHVHWTGDAIQPSHLLSPSSPSSFNLSQHQALFHWVGCLYQVARVWELQLQHQHQSFQWVFRVDSL